MATFERFDIVRVPFPFTDRTAEMNRPALVLSSARHFNGAAQHSVMAMITSAAHTRWPLDVEIRDLKHAGLPAPSLVRFKLFTLDHRLVRGSLGQLSDEDGQRVRRGLDKLIGR
jgi:mRNA interferase MazF